MSLDQAIAQDLTAIADLLDKYDRHSAARFSERLRAPYFEASALVATFDTNEFWGGPGSLADQGMCVQESANSGDFPEARRDYWNRMAHLGEYLAEHGAHNPRLRSWVSVFQQWRRQGL